MKPMQEIKYFARNVLGAFAGLVHRRTGFRYSKDYRHATTPRHARVYAVLNTIAANHVADGGDFRAAVFWGYARQARYNKPKGT